MAAHVETIGVDVGSSVLLRYCCFEDLSSGGGNFHLRNMIRDYE